VIRTLEGCHHFLTPLFRVWIYFRLLSGGLRYAATTGYYLTALQAESYPLPPGATDLIGPRQAS
jgi:hypothetical protein